MKTSHNVIIGAGFATAVLLGGCSSDESARPARPAPVLTAEADAFATVGPSPNAIGATPSPNDLSDICQTLVAAGHTRTPVEKPMDLGQIATREGLPEEDIRRFNQSVLGEAVLGAVLQTGGGCIGLPKSRINTLTDLQIARMNNVSWRAGCLATPAELRRVYVPYVAFDGSSRTGEIDVHKSVANDIAEIFEKMYSLGFPLDTVKPLEKLAPKTLATLNLFEAQKIDAYSMDANNTSAFNCRYVPDKTPPTVSSHGYGLAVDINPLQNPFLSLNGTKVSPLAGKDYLNRDKLSPGMLGRDTALGAQVIQLFTERGWTWGGDFNGPDKDWQHFSKKK